MQERFSKSPQNLDSYDLFEWLFPLSTVSVWRGQTTMKHSDLCDIRASAGSRPKTVVWTGRQDVEETLCCLQLRWVGCTQRGSCFFCAARWMCSWMKMMKGLFLSPIWGQKQSCKMVDLCRKVRRKLVCTRILLFMGSLFEPESTSLSQPHQVDDSKITNIPRALRSDL